jgi:hypothetical protein
MVELHLDWKKVMVELHPSKKQVVVELHSFKKRSQNEKPFKNITNLSDKERYGVLI